MGSGVQCRRVKKLWRLIFDIYRFRFLFDCNPYFCKNSVNIISLNQIVTFCIMAMLFAQTFSKNFIVIDYYANTSTYEKDCVNKNKPWMHCNGQCQMMKKMRQEENKDQQNPERKADNKNETVLSSKSFFVQLTPPSFILLSSVSPRINTQNIPVGNACDIFHPPQRS